MTMLLVQPLDLQTIFVDYLAGSWSIFFFLALIFFTYLAARFRMPGRVLLPLLAIFVILIQPWYSSPLYGLAIFMTAIIAGQVFSKIFKT